MTYRLVNDIITVKIDDFLSIVIKNFSNIGIMKEKLENLRYESYNDRLVDLKLFIGSNSVVSPHFHRSFEMIYVISGSLKAVVNGEEIVASADDIVFVQRYYSHSYDVISDYKKYVFMIPPNIYTDFEKPLAKMTLPAHMTDKEFNRSLKSLIDNLQKNIASKSKLIKKGYMDVIIGELISHYPLSPIQKNNSIELLVNILDYIDANYDKPLTLDSISTTFGYNKYYFSKLFNRYIGENLNNYVNIVRLQQMMKKAKGKENVSIIDLAYECGFESLATFYRYFKKIYGKTPKEALGGKD